MAVPSVDHQLIDRLVDRSCALGDRIAAAKALSEHDGAAIVGALIIVAQRVDTPPSLSKVVGEALARVYFRNQEDLDDLSFADMAGDAYKAFDAEMASLLRASPGISLKRPGR